MADIKSLEDTLEISCQKSDVPGQLRALSRLEQAYQIRRQYQKALTYSRRALDLVKDQSNPDKRIIVLANMGCVYWEMAQLKKAMDLFKEALTLAKEVEDTAGQTMLLTILGISYWRKLAWDPAIQYFQQAMQLHQNSNIPTASHEDPEAYGGIQKTLERGLTSLKNRVHIAMEHQDATRILQSKFSMLPLLFFTGRTEETLALLEEITSQAQQLKRSDLLVTIPKLQKLLNTG